MRSAAELAGAASPTEDYHAKAVDWEADRDATRVQSQRRAWMVAWISMALTSILAVALAMLAPLRVKVPYVFTVDRATGSVEAVSAVDDRTVLGYQELLDKHWARRYVVAREGYVYRLLQSDYDTVMGMSNEAVARDYGRVYEGERSRDKVLGPNVDMRIAVQSVQLAREQGKGRAVVRFERETRSGEGENQVKLETFTASLAYEYQPSMKGTERDLVTNPLGFRVVSYRVDAEFTPEVKTMKAQGG